MDYIKFFENLNRNDAHIAGGKGASLGEMFNFRILVPNGFVILSGAFEKFLEQTGLVQEIEAVLGAVNHNAIHTIDAASEKIRELILTRKMPEAIKKEVISSFVSLDTQFVAVRSSATAEDGKDNAWAGQLESYLNVEKDDLVIKVQNCWSSLFTPRAIFYRFEKGLNATKISVAVVVQKMINSEKSGVAFSVHPVTEDRNQLIIEAGYGLGEAIVSGSITPDSYVVSKNPRAIIDISVNSQKKGLYRKSNGGNEWIELDATKASSQVLSKKEILELSNIIIDIENHYGFPCDVEWAFEDGQFYITQSRPITALANIGQKKYQAATSKTKWEKVLQRNFPPLAWTSNAYYEFRGFTIGQMKWTRGKEILIKYNTVQSFMIQDPTAYYITNICDVIQHVDADFEIEIDRHNASIYDGVRITPGKTLKYLYELNELHKQMCALMLIGFDVVVDIKNQIDKYVINLDERLIDYLETPWKPTAIQRERLAIQEAKTQIAKNPDAKEKIIATLVTEYGYIHQDYLGEPWTIADYERSLQDETALNSHMDTDYAINTYSEYEQWLITIFKKFLYMYEEGRNAMVRCAWAMKETMKSLGNDPSAVLYMTATEVGLYAKGEQGLISSLLIEERKKAFAVYFEGTQYQEYSGEEEVARCIEEQNIKHFWEDNADQTQSVKGTVAFKGYAKGLVRLVFTQADANAVEEGEIIVTPMTQVEFLSGIRKCAAIVTDEGGIICHAAIVSREFGKPCILATQKATKVFKNGDRVEVDANQGVVLLLNSN